MVGSLAAAISGSASWLFLAYDEAAPTSDTLYNVGGTIEYEMDGLPTSIDLFPDTIHVSPNPQLELVYFHEYDIFGDDPFTPQIEPSVPYHLAVLVKNVGYGEALDFKILSSQPEIIENEKGLLIDFQIIEAEIDGVPTDESLLIDFGSIPAQSTKVGLWKLTSSLQGFFSDYNATFKYKGPLNNDQLAIIDKVDIWELSHLV